MAAVRFAAGIRGAAITARGLATIGALRTEPGTPTAIADRVRLTLDLRHRELEALERLDSQAVALSMAAADPEGCTLERNEVWSIDPVRFDAGLVARARELTGTPPLTSGPLHDAAAVARAGVPTVMVFARTRGGVSHSRAEDAREEDLIVAIDAFTALVQSLMK
jgi:N-carbamoyl-L-amino-acid hydrolase